MTSKKYSVIQLLHTAKVQDMIKYAQIFPAEMLAEVMLNAQAHGVTLEVEMASILLASFVEANGLDSLSRRIMAASFSRKEAEQECKRRREGWQCIFEIEKLKLYLSMKSKLPRQFKEHFRIIDVKAETKRILEEWRSSQNE